jgi:hypothetical protein
MKKPTNPVAKKPTRNVSTMRGFGSFTAIPLLVVK